MAVLVVGGSGYVGLHLLKALAARYSPENIAYTYNSHPPPLSEQLGVGYRVDLTTGQGLQDLALSVHPRVVVNCAAMSVPRDCEENPQKAMAVNVPRALLRYLASLQTGAPPLLVHFSTDQVYEGIKQFYVETDETKPVNVYGLSKVEAEFLIRSTWRNYAILRSSIIYGPQPVVHVQKPLPVQWMDMALSARRPVDFFHDEYRCPIFIGDVVKVVALLITLSEQSGGAMQLVLNLGGPERLSRAEMAQVVARVKGYHPSLINQVPASSVDRGVASPADISMDVEKLRSTLGICLTPFDEGVRQTLMLAA
ncbi:hypothetical protein SELMODRAFT_151824 [Selaginella moellendorffii]|uniref:RmlD-like substrate binding domain-containing protein n=1 Tax=Selaginella moellendorffii TaxID=88036 RepID=D8S2M6_SELML|nr:uncharacterized protein LOC9639394 [Selaginella moellendorffii]XP_024538336.1 uncharacterized protein LOC9639394 [Selaginella moellendorffii]XP_024538337.1 uncharacterized protein LOC9639394 [Selaginella moellendorffii]EFJ21319.1 hypothetical protein SELMODRAFT_151824 [Selaginella moellendorffii]|eukprot:XP_002977315.1 uncharacterized protein LOC9639394 [Selaginella moellendorffii]